MRFAPVLVLALASLAYACEKSSTPVPPTPPTPDTGAATTEAGTLAGTLCYGPPAPVGGLEEQHCKPASGIQVVAIAQGAGAEQAAASDARGSFSLRLAPGAYQVTLRDLPPNVLPRDLPPSVTITAGQPQTLDIRLDTGLR